MERIEADLVQNYSPCSECADDFLNFIYERNRDGIKFSLKIEFANVYKDWVFDNKDGLKKLKKKGVRFELLEGEEKWRAFLNDETFVELTEREKTGWLNARARSEARKRNEVKALEIFNDIGLGNNDITGLGNITQPSGK
jgi:hypothetical protein